MVLRPFTSALIFASLSLTGCATTESAETPTSETKAANEAAEKSPDRAPPEAKSGLVSEEDGSALAEGSNGDEEEEPELSAEDFEQGFCVDDIYAKYLTKEFSAQHKSVKAPETTTRRSRRHGRRDAIDRSAYEGLSYARTRMNGPTAPFFGAIPIVVNDRVDFWVQYFKTQGRKQFMSWLVRGESLKRMVQPILQDSGVPMEFFYLAMVESGFSNSAYSRARATGTWQFMSSTAQLYGLKINHWVDERRDPVKSTLAAANYLKDLYADLGDWHLAMAAYNAGPGKIRKAMRLGKSRDYWDIAETRHLAKETKQYVPKVLAAILLSTQYRLHGFDVQSNPTDLMPETEVVVKRPVLLQELASKLGVPRKSLVSWNPELIRDITPPGKSGYPLRLPVAYANLFPKIENELSYVEVTDIQMHTLRRGDTLSRLAKQYKVAIKQILDINPGVKASRLRPGNTIAIPVPGVVSSIKKADHVSL